MNKNEYIIAEYNQLKNEIAVRVRLLHLFILVAVLLSFTSLLFVFVMIYADFELNKIILFLLLLPIIFALLTFNYQANQMTLEGLAGYIGYELKNKMPKELKTEIIKWDEYYGQYKKAK